MSAGPDVLGDAEVTFKKKEQDSERVKEGLRKFREAAERDAKQMASRGSGLPKDWRSRVLK